MTGVWLPALQSAALPAAWQSAYQKALDSQSAITGELLLHSDHGRQYTSKAFAEFYESVHVTHSMSKVGYPYDNAPLERYFNTPKNECTNLFEFRTEESLYQKLEEFAYVTYNHVRPHSYNGYRTPYQARTAVQEGGAGSRILLTFVFLNKKISL